MPSFSVHPDSAKNHLALEVITCIILHCCWMNVHIVQPHDAVFEIRVAEGYGARWFKDGTKFIGFLEPYMQDGHSKKWRHWYHLRHPCILIPVWQSRRKFKMWFRLWYSKIAVMHQLHSISWSFVGWNHNSLNFNSFLMHPVRCGKAAFWIPELHSLFLNHLYV